MGEVKIIGEPVPNVPWQERPNGSKTWMPVWRYSDNPVIGRNPIEGVARIFNSAVMPYEGEFIGVFRGEQINGIPYIYLGRRILRRTRYLLRMKREKILCRGMRMIQDL